MRARTGLLLSALAAIELGIGFLNQTFVLAQLGATRQADVYFSSVAVVQLVIAVLFSPMVSVSLPLLAELDETRRRASAGGLIRMVGVASAAFVVVAAVTCPYWIPVVWPGFDADTRQVALSVIPVQLITLVPTGLFMMLRARAYASRTFVIAEAIAVVMALVALVAMMIALPRVGVVATGWVNLGRVVAMSALLFAVLPAASRREEAVDLRPEAWRRARPLIAGAAYYKSEGLVDQYLSSQAAPGALATLSFAKLLWTAGVQVVGQAVIVPITPELASLHGEGRLVELRAIVRRQVLLMLGLMSAAGLLVVALGRPVLMLLATYGLGGRAGSVEALWLLLVLLLGVPIAGAVGQVLTTAFNAVGETKLMTIAGAAGFTIGLALKIAGFHWGGLHGLALGTTAYYALDVLSQWIVLELRLRRRIADQSRNLSHSTE